MKAVSAGIIPLTDIPLTSVFADWGLGICQQEKTEATEIVHGFFWQSERWGQKNWRELVIGEI
jgi:hypothetical protein